MKALPIALAMIALVGGCAHFTAGGTDAISPGCRFRAAAPETRIPRNRIPSPPNHLAYGQLWGVAATLEGRPLTHAIVTIRAEASVDSAVSPDRRFITGNDGSFLINNISDSTYILEVRRDGFARQLRKYQGMLGIIDTFCVRLPVDSLRGER